MPPLYFLVVWVSLLHSAISHILIPPFLPDGHQKQYYEQKFRISQLDNAVFKISGLPRDIFWTSNGTIFGTPSNFGQWTINIAYDSLTQSGNYETLLVIKRPNVIRDIDSANGQKSRPLEIIFPESLIFEKNNQQQIEFKINNAVGPVEWRFVTLPRGVQQSQDGRLMVKIEKEGIYIVRIQVIDQAYNQIQACVTLNVQNSKSSLTESYSPTKIYESSENVNRMLEVTKKETVVTKQLTQAAIKLGEEGKILEVNEQIYQRVSNNLIQLQNRAKHVSKLIETSIRDKRDQEQRIKQSSDILKDAEDSLNLAMIQQLSNNNLLKESSIEKDKAQITYDNAAKSLQSQDQVLKNVEHKMLFKQKQRDVSIDFMNQKKTIYAKLGDQVAAKEKELALINELVFKVSQQVQKSDSSVKSQTTKLAQQEDKYTSIFNSLNLHDSKIQQIRSEIQELMSQRSKITDQIVSIESLIRSMERNELFNLQRDIQQNDFAIETLLFDAIKEWNQIQYSSKFIKDYVAQVKFGGCGQSQYPSVQGVFTVKEVSSFDESFETESGHRILYGKCTQALSGLRIGQQIIASGYTAQGVIHADKIVQQ